VSVVANVAVNLDATSVVQRLKQIRDSAIGAGDAFKKLDASAKAVKAAVEASGGGFAKASTVVGVFAAKVKNTENAIRAQIAALRAVQASVQLGGALYQKAAGQIKQYEDALRKASGAADDAGGGLDGLKGKIATFVGGLALATTAINVVKSSLNAAFERGQAETRLRALTSAYGETTEATKLAAAASDKFGLTQTEATKSIADVYGRLRPLGFSLKEISGVYDGFNTLSKQASLTTQESAAVFTQLSQALGSGTLRGDEFNRMAESMPAILGVVAKELGVSQNALRNMAADGKISADVVVRGLKKVADAGGDLDKFLDPSTKAMNKLAKESENAQVALGNLLKPAAIAVMESLAKALEFTSKNLKQIAQTAVFFATFAGTLKVIALGTQAWATASKALAAGQKAAGIAAAFLQGVMNPASLATTALALGAATAASFALGKAMDGAAADANKIDPAAQKAAKATALATEEAKKLKEEMDKAKAKATELAIEMQTKVVSAAKAASAAIEGQMQAKAQVGSIVSAQIDGELKLNQLRNIGLEREYKFAKSARERAGLAIQIARNEIKSAQLVYQQTLANLQIENEQLKLKERAAVLKGAEIIAEGKLQILKAKTPEEAAQKAAQLNDAIAAQNQVIQMTAKEVAGQQLVNQYLAKNAEAQYKVAAATTATALEQRLMGEDIKASAGSANSIANDLYRGATNSQTMSGLSAELAGRMNNAAMALDAGTEAAVQNAVQYGMVAEQGANSTDAWRQKVLEGVGAQRQVAVAAQQTTQQVVAANNIRAKSATQTNKQIEEDAGFSAKRLQKTFETAGREIQLNFFDPLGKAWKTLVNFFPELLKNAIKLVQSTFQGLVNSTKSIIRSLLQSVANAINSVGTAINNLIGAYNRLPNAPDIPFVPRISVPAFAEGGVVSRPTLAMVGEAGPEYIIPASKMAEASANYLSGARGNSVIPSQGSGNAQINVTTGPVMQQGGQQYVTLADLENAMRKTADGIYASLRTPAGRYAVGTR
jgi:tape measure domain-containing protein